MLSVCKVAATNSDNDGYCNDDVLDEVVTTYNHRAISTQQQQQQQQQQQLLLVVLLLERVQQVTISRF